MNNIDFDRSRLRTFKKESEIRPYEREPGGPTHLAVPAVPGMRIYNYHIDDGTIRILFRTVKGMTPKRIRVTGIRQPVDGVSGFLTPEDAHATAMAEATAMVEQAKETVAFYENVLRGITGVPAERFLPPEPEPEAKAP